MAFIEISTLYKHVKERTVDELAELYSNQDILQSTIHGFFINHIPIDVIKDKSVLLKPNWVQQDIKPYDNICLRTNDSLLLCILGEVLKMKPSKVLIADAPIQGCDWEKMLSKDFLSSIQELADKYHTLVEVKDFRRTVTHNNHYQVSTGLRPLSEYVIFDLGDKSYLEPITTDKGKFRVTCYNPDKLAEVHHPGMHKFCVTKDVFDYDVIFTIPKLKTHRMAGITNALKLLVGINGDKDFLPHHRIGSVKEGGDNYKDYNLLRSMSNRLTDAGNRKRGSRIGRLLERGGILLWKLSKPDKSTLINAGWYGNDTIWRTVMDLNTIAVYGDSNGILHDIPQRKLITIVDGIVGGQGDGPLHPEPSPLGVLAISDNSYLTDVVAGHLYHLDIDRIPLLREASKIIRNQDNTVIADGNIVSIDRISEYGIDVKMSPGWEDYRRE